MSEKVKYHEAGDDEWPVCPTCRKELREVKFKQRGWLTSLMVIWCPHCRAVLGTSATFNA